MTYMKNRHKWLTYSDLFQYCLIWFEIVGNVLLPYAEILKDVVQDIL